MVGSEKKEANSKNRKDLIDWVFSWTLEDILNDDLLKHEVEKIPESFQSVEHYFGSYLFPLLEETRAELSSNLKVITRAPFAEVASVEESKPFLYKIKVESWRNKHYNHHKEPYRTLPGDVFIVSDATPETFSDLQCSRRTWTLGWVPKFIENGYSSSVDDCTYISLKASKDIGPRDGMQKQKSLFLVFLTNMTTNTRIWKSLQWSGNMNIIKEVLCTNSVDEKICGQCSLYSNAIYAEKLGIRLPPVLNESQRAALLCSVCKMQCNHLSSVELIWGPPGTGKTKTVSLLLWTVLEMNRRVLTCAPTNVAITEVASRVLKLLKESTEKCVPFHSLGDLLLFGNKDRLKVGSNLEEIYLDYRVDRLIECFGPQTGWKHHITSMINFFENYYLLYQAFVECELNKNKGSKKKKNISCKDDRSFLGFTRERFKSTASPLRSCVQNLCTHIPRSFILEHNWQNMEFLFKLLDSFETYFSQDDLASEELKVLFSCPELILDSSNPFTYASTFLCLRNQCLSVLRTLQLSLEHLQLPGFVDKNTMKKFCFQRALLIFCTVSSSFKLHKVKMEPLNLLVIDEAAQLKECESTIPLQLPGINHAILIGDEYQLPATVTSKVSEEAGFGRSLFERLSLLCHSRHLLNIQYRMHPSVSRFPNSRFYMNQILDAPNVKNRSYVKHYLPGSMYGPYSFINVFGGKEELDDVGRSRKNMVEVAVVVKIVQNLYQAWIHSKMKISIGVISPYTAQVVAIQEKFGRRFEKIDGFVVKVKSVDGFQGGEEDVIIMSTVRSGRSIGFLSSPQRINVALTRARHCLWILGNGTTLANDKSVWEALVNDAKDRKCFFSADEDKDLANAILEVKEELLELEDMLLNKDSILFKRVRWKVLFSDNFRKSFWKLKSDNKRKSVLILLLRLSSGWRPKKDRNSVCKSSSQTFKQFMVEGLYIICTVDIEKDSEYIQVLKVWDILPSEDVQILVKYLDDILRMYTDDFLSHCKQICLEGDFEVPMRWGASHDIVRYKNLNKSESESYLSAIDTDHSCFGDLNIHENLLHMKFYLLSYPMVSHLLSGRDIRGFDLPYQVSDQQLEIILYPRSTFLIGRPGTQKIAVLSTKLFQRERQHHIAPEGFNEIQTNIPDVSSTNKDDERCKMIKGTVLRQIFISVTPQNCVAVKQHLSYLNRIACGEHFSAESNLVDMHHVDDTAQFRSLIDMHDIDDTSQFMDVPDTFVDIPLNSYPLVITFRKFLMMLDGSAGASYFERFHQLWELSHCKNRNLRSIALQTFLRSKEVNYDKFSSSYWPHFNFRLTRKLDAFTVFTEITCHIKGGLQTGEPLDGRLSRKNYVLLSEVQVSALSRKKREKIYDIFLDYEKRKRENGEYDLADLVIDLHHRIQNNQYEGQEMDFVYVDEVQGLTMREVALFKYICRNVNVGFVFSCNTAQTIARGINFRFQDIRSLFYNKFMLESRSDGNDKGTVLRQISDIIHMSQNCQTNPGVLRLAQSVIDLLFCFFPLSIDILCPETSDISVVNGEAPVFLELAKDENVITTIFGNTGNVGKSVLDFGAEMVILVRNNRARKEIADRVGKQALVLEIMECQGLEFQDVLLYNFFGSSSLKNQWGVIYEYMKEQDMLDSTSHRCDHSFNQAKCKDLCWELKLLYVAITRSRKRLWICEDIEELSNPMFVYWKKLCLVQVRQLDNSLVQAMQVTSSKEEWSSQGVKLYCEGSYEMASVCFQRAGDTYREKWAKAAGLRIAADCLRGSNPERAITALWKAAEIFNTIGRVESAAQCFIELREYKKAATMYVTKYGESRLEEAGDSFYLAECYELAADAYLRGNYFSKFLYVCTTAKLFDMGLQFIQRWKQHDNSNVDITKRSQEIEEITNVFLEKGALHYCELRDNNTMMKFVRAFHPMDSKRSFLKSMNCFDDLLLLEKESGNFMEAAAIAKKKGELLLEVDLLEKAGHFIDASMLLLFYVFASSLWASGNKGWPMKEFKRKKKLLTKVKLLAKVESDSFYEFVCTEANILLNQESTLLEMKQNLSASQRHENLRGIIISARRILDVHLRSSISRYAWENQLVTDLAEHMEEKISQNQVSVDTLVYFWNFWREKIVNVILYLGCLETQEFNECQSLEEFCLYYLGVRKQLNYPNVIYLLLNSDADWARRIDVRSLQSNGNVVSMDVQQFVAAARSYWCSEVLSVAMKVLEKLKTLHMLSVNNFLPVCCQCITAVHIFEVTKFLTDSKFLESFTDNYTKEKVSIMGLQSILYLRKHDILDAGVVNRSQEMFDSIHCFLVRCALHYHELQENSNMLKFVRAFHSMDSKRSFLMKLGSFNELLSLEVETGNFMEAATIAKLRGDLLLEADMLEKACHYKDASFLLLLYVFAKSLWTSGSNGWPLKLFRHKEKLLTRAMSIAKYDSNIFYEIVCLEANILSNKAMTLIEMKQNFTASQKHNNVRGVVLSARRILDTHLQSKLSKYEWKDELMTDPMKHSEGEIFQIDISVETLVYFWNFWRDSIVNIYEYLCCLGTKDLNDYMSHGEFCLSYLGVRKQFNNGETLYILLISDAGWARKVDGGSLQINGGLVSMSASQFVSAAQSYWCAELLSVGMKVLENLKALFMFSVRNSFSELCQSMTAIHFLEAVKFLTESKFIESSTDNTLEELSNMRLQFLQYCKQHVIQDVSIINSSQETDEIEHFFLERCALYFYKLRDNRTMMKFVKAFHSMDSKRFFLKSLECYDELLLLEEESGNYMEATFIARLKGDLFLEVDLLQKAGHFKEAAVLICFYVLANSLWTTRSQGWPLKQFMQKEELLIKAKSFAKKCSDVFYDIVCTDASILVDGESSLFEMKHYLSTSQKNNNLVGEILSARKILDSHLYLNTSKYEWEHELVTDQIKHLEDKFSQNQVSIETLVDMWNFWKEKIVNVIESLEHLEIQNANEYIDYEEFCLNFLGVRKQFDNHNTYQLLISDADWVKYIDVGSLQRDGKLVSMDVRQFGTAALNYWSTELLSVGMKVLEKLSALQMFSIRNSFSAFYQCITAIHMFQVTKFLMESKFSKLSSDGERLQTCLESSTGYFFDNVFSLDWTKSLTKNMIALRGTRVSRELLKEVVLKTLNSENELTYGKIGTIAMVIFGSGNLTVGLYELIGKRLDGNLPWKALIDELKRYAIASELSEDSVASKVNETPGQGFLISRLLEALRHTYYANWREGFDYISPNCFLYLVERLVLISNFQGFFYTTRSSFVEWLICNKQTTSPSTSLVTNMKPSLGDYNYFVAHIIHQLLMNKSNTMEWIRRSDIDSKGYYPRLVLRLVVLMCLLCVNSGQYFNVLYSLLDMTDISSQLPEAVNFILKKRRNDKRSFVRVLASALGRIENPLVIVSFVDHCKKSLCPGAIAISLKNIQHQEDILRVLFPKNVKDVQTSAGLFLSNNEQGRCANISSMKFDVAFDQDMKIAEDDVECEPIKSSGHLWETFNSLKLLEDGCDKHVKSSASDITNIKVKSEKNIHRINASITQSFQNNSCDSKDENILVNSTLDELKKLSIVLDVSDVELLNNISTIREPLSNDLTMQNPKNAAAEACQTSIASGSQKKKKDENRKAKEKSHTEKGKMMGSTWKQPMVWQPKAAAARK